MTHLRAVLVLSLFAAGCADVSNPEPAEPPASKTITQEVVDEGAPNWMAVGGAGAVELVGGTDGEPNELAGRFVLDGREVVATSGGADRWIIAGAQHTQPLDDDAFRLTEARDALGGETIAFVARGSSDWLIGGSGGAIQLLDAQGEPTQTTLTVLGGRMRPSRRSTGSAGSSAAKTATWSWSTACWTPP